MINVRGFATQAWTQSVVICDCDTVSRHCGLWSLDCVICSLRPSCSRTVQKPKTRSPASKCSILNCIYRGLALAPFADGFACLPAPRTCLPTRVLKRVTGRSRPRPLARAGTSSMARHHGRAAAQSRVASTGCCVHVQSSSVRTPRFSTSSSTRPTLAASTGGAAPTSKASSPLAALFRMRMYRWT